MIKSFVVQGVPVIADKPQKLNGTDYKTSEVVENDEFCGFEVSPCLSDDMITNPTDPLSIHSSETVSTNPSSEEIPEQHSEDVATAGVPAVAKGSKTSALESALIKSRLEDLFDVLDDDDEGLNWKDDPILQLQVEYIEHDDECESNGRQDGQTQNSNITLGNRTLAKKVEFNVEKEFINLLEPSPTNIFSDIFTRTHQTLCQVLLGAVDVPFLFNKRKQQPQGDGGGIHAPFMMFPEQNRALVSLKTQDNYVVSSSGPLNEKTLTQLFGLYAHMKRSNAKVKNIAYQKGLPSVSGTDPVHLESNKLQLRLNGWKKRPTKGLDEETPSTWGSEETEEKYVVPDTSLIPLVAGQDKSDDVADLCNDEELKAVLKITKGGDEVSPLFPSFSEDTHTEICSDDGLNDELGALDNINDELRKELQFADVVINGSACSASADSLFRRTWRKMRRKKQDDSFLHRNGSDTTRTLSTTDSEHSRGTSEDSDDAFKRMSEDSDDALERTSEDSDDAFKNQRRVRFAKEHIEISYCQDMPILIGVEFTQNSESHEGSQAWFGNLEEAYAVFEDMLDEFALGCTNYVERNLKQPPFKI